MEWNDVKLLLIGHFRQTKANFVMGNPDIGLLAILILHSASQRAGSSRLS